MKKRTLIALTLGCLLLAACGAEQKQEETTPMTYTQITQEEAQRIMREEEGYLIVDVRRSDEFAEGHIPGPEAAGLLPLRPPQQGGRPEAGGPGLQPGL